ncbi:MAG: cyclase family protein [Desulfobacteraceae bacterium]|jgi:kynurenine formamidase
MDRIIDLSYEITQDTKVHPFDTPIKLFQDRYLEKDKFNGYRLETGLHVGTHIDAPMHLTNQNKYIGEFPLEQFYGPGCLLDVRDERVIHVKSEYNEN